MIKVLKISFITQFQNFLNTSISEYYQRIYKIPDASDIGLYPEVNMGLSYEASMASWKTALISPTNSGIRYFHTNKIRALLGSHMKKKGFPVKIHARADFNALCMLAVPSHSIVEQEYTVEQWALAPFNTFRNVWIFDFRKDNYLENSYNEARSFVSGFVPYGGFASAGQSLSLKYTTIRPYPIFENLITYGGLNDIFIYMNWDKIKRVLDKLGV